MNSGNIFVKFLELYHGKYDYGNINGYSPIDTETIRIYISDGSAFDFSYYDDEDYELVQCDLELEYSAHRWRNFLHGLKRTVAIILLTFLLGSYTCGVYALCADVADTYVAADPIEVETVATEPETVPDFTESIETEEAPTDPIDISTEPSEEPQIEIEPETEPEPTETIPEISEEDVEMLACVIYTEVGGCCEDCCRYVGDVVLNRVNDPRFPDTIYEVLTQPRQYSTFSNGIKWPSRANNAYEAKYVERAYRIARELLEGKHSKLYGENYIWQAAFVQGKEGDGFWCCGTYYGKG